MPEPSIAQRLQAIKQRIHLAETNYHRPLGSVQLLAVSKGQDATAIEQAYEGGQRDFGENYVQEALIKIRSLSHLDLQWHFIGPIQSNKTKIIATEFSWVHSLCRLTIAQQLHAARNPSLPRLNVCLQVNLDEEDSKSGVACHLLPELAQAVLQLPRLQLRGLMTIPAPQIDTQRQYHSLLRLSNLLHSLNSDLNLSLDTLSMGMSDDLDAAIHAGSTIVRIGKAIFGERTPH